MTRKLTSKTLAQLAVVLSLAFGLKAYYSTATVDQLKWILTPTTRLVEFVSGRTFEFEAHAGYMSSDHRFLIAASCAGVNFLLTAFLMLSLARVWEQRKTEHHDKRRFCGWGFLPSAIAFAYVTTIVANTVRIALALQMQQTPVRDAWMNANQLHRLEGILVYFGFLLLLFVITQKRLTEARSILRLCWFPLSIYYATTIGLPLFNGALGRNKDAFEHLLVVLVVPLVILLCGSVFRYAVGQVTNLKSIGCRSTLGTDQN